MEITYGTIKKYLEEEKYIATDNIIWKVAKDVKKMKKDKQKGQDIYAICLEGPPGAGKSFYAETYKKIIEKIYNEEVEMIQYQCDGTTGKAELYEEIRVAAAIAGNPDEVIIAGKLVEAIDAVNSGKKVILFLDEFEKSRRETDSFLYGFLQNGIVITTQRGILQVKPEHTKNLQVILCKNDERELSDPLLRRCYIMRLEEMTPENFYKTININLPECDQDVKDVVAILYEKMYEEKDNFAKFPSCSEGMKAIQDACDYIEMNAPEEVIYCDILSNLLKHPDDIETFKEMFKKDTKIGEFVSKTIGNKTETDDNNKLQDEIYKEFFNKELQKISGMEELYKAKEASYKRVIENLNNQVIELQRNMTDKNCDEKKSKELKKDKILKLEEVNPNDEVIYYSPDIIGNMDSVFGNNPIEEWCEIAKIKVNEDGSKIIEEIINGGPDFVRNMYKKMYPNGLPGSMGPDKYKEIYSGKDKILDKNTIRIDGIILDEDEKSEDKFKIVARRVKEKDEYFYKIYSNKKIQTKRYILGRRGEYKDYFDCSDYSDYIGFDSFVKILKFYEMIIDYKEDFLLVEERGISEIPKKFNGYCLDEELLKNGIIKKDKGTVCCKNIEAYLYRIFSINLIQKDLEITHPFVYSSDYFKEHKEGEEKEKSARKLAEFYEENLLFQSKNFETPNLLEENER